MSKHTPEPWRSGKPGAVVSDTPVPGMRGSDDVDYYGGHLIGESIVKANVSRIVSCVNACAGMEDPAAEIAELKLKRDLLLSAMNEIYEMLIHESDGFTASNKAEEMARLAIAAQKDMSK